MLFCILPGHRHGIGQLGLKISVWLGTTCRCRRVRMSRLRHMSPSSRRISCWCFSFLMACFGDTTMISSRAWWYGGLAEWCAWIGMHSLVPLSGYLHTRFQASISLDHKRTISEKLFGNGWVKVTYIERYERVLEFVGNCFKPVDDVWGTSP